MGKNLHATFTNARHQPQIDLSDVIWHAIIERDTREARIRLWFYGLLGALSLGALFPAVSSMLSSFAQSGFSEYLSLLFSDGAMVMSFWKEFALSLAQTLPATSILISSCLLFILLLSIRRALRQFNSIWRTA